MERSKEGPSRRLSRKTIKEEYLYVKRRFPMVTKDKQKIYSYAILQAIYENGYDLINCIEQVVLQFIPDYDFTDVFIIKNDLKDIVDLPELMVKKVLDTAIDKGHVDFDEKRELYRLRPDAMQKIIENQKAVNNRVRELIQRINHYYIEHGVIPGMSIPEMIEDFIEKSGFDMDFLHPDRDVNPAYVETEQISLKTLIQFLQDPLTKKADKATFREFIMGSIISKALEWTDLDSVNLTSFNTCELFLDTNFVFSLLDLHEDRINRPVKEMYKELIRRFDFKIKVFDFTVEQMKRVICAYSPENMVYAPDAQIPSIYNTFKGLEWGKEQAIKYSEKLPKELARRGITIHNTGLILNETNLPKSISLSEFIELYGNLLAQYKPMSTRYGIKHDLAAVYMIKKMRNVQVRDLGDARAFFLTSDRRLTDFCQREMRHKDERSISEVVLDMSFATLLWCLLKDHKMQFSIDTIIAAFSRTLFISRKVWDKFMLILSQIAQKKRVSLEEIPNIFYKKIQNILNEFSDEDADLVTEPFIMAKISEALTDQEVIHDKMLDMREDINEKDRRIKMQDEQINKLTQRINETEFEIECHSEQKKKITRNIKKLICVVTGLIIVIIFLLLYILVI
jgi:tetrahydromethanopterin S-methyltransferase subunit G